MVVTEHTPRIPLESYRVPNVTTTLLRAVVPLAIRVAPNRFKERNFVVDCASAMTTIAVLNAHRPHLPVSYRSIHLKVETATGPVIQIRHPGRIQGRVLGLPGWDFDWPCHFVEHTGPPPKAVIGLTGVLDDLRITFDGAYAQEAPYGWLILERRR